MMLKKIYRGQKCQIGRPFSRIEEDGRKWLRRPKLCPKSCRAILRRRRMWVLPTNTECQVCDKSQLLNRCVNLHVENCSRLELKPLLHSQASEGSDVNP
jgi:hypothetical protein